MADVRYFSGDVRLHQLQEIARAEFEALFPGAVAARWSPGMRLIGLPEGMTQVWDREAGRWSRTGFLPAERQVTFKARPSLHECDARCMNATGRTMQCECSCGGKNHGKGARLTCG